MAKALYGQGHEEPLCALAPAGAWYEVYHQTMRACARQLAAHLGPVAAHQDGPAPPSRPPRHKQRQRTQPAWEVRGSLPRGTGVARPIIEGSDATTALRSLSEGGLERRRWPTVQPGTSWLGLGPHQRGSGGTGLRRRPTSSAQRVATARRVGAACRHPSHRAFGACCRRMQARLGPPKASPAPAHKFARLLSPMLQHGTTYGQRGMDAYAQQSRDRAVQSLTRRAQAFGYPLVHTPVGTHS
jgi:transposase